MEWFKSIIEKAKKAFVWLFKDWRNVAVVALLISAVVLYFNYNRYRNKYENAVIERNDSTTVYKNKIGELYAERETYITDIKNLKASNSELYAEVEHLKDHPVIITKYETVTEYKEIHVTDTAYVVKTGVFSNPIKYSDDWTFISGTNVLDTNTMVSETNFDTIRFNNNFTLDLIESKKSSTLSFIVKSDNPYCQINNVDGVVLSPEDVKSIKKRYDKNWVVVAGIGPSFTIVNNKFAVLPALQLTVGYKLISF